jgi:hypothetical protein
VAVASVQSAPLSNFRRQGAIRKINAKAIGHGVFGACPYRCLTINWLKVGILGGRSNDLEPKVIPASITHYDVAPFFHQLFFCLG